jgi:hypothetical protein
MEQHAPTLARTGHKATEIRGKPVGSLARHAVVALYLSDVTLCIVPTSIDDHEDKSSGGGV